MFNGLWETIRGSLSLSLYFLNTIFWCIPLFALVIAKAVIPVEAWRRRCTRMLNAIAENWIWVNNQNQKMVGNTCWEVQGVENLERSDWYLVLANHQSWVDILVLQRIFHKKIPFLKFFIKKELIWFPVLGQAWWAMDFPFVKRYSKNYLRKNPHLKGKDLEITRKACQKFRKIPISIMNFVEGTRFTSEKHRQQQSPYDHLLKPRAGGIAYVLDSMAEQIHRVLDVTIVYPDGKTSFWALVCGKIQRIKVRVRSLPVGPELLGDYANDGQFRSRLQSWLNNLWEEKNQCMKEMLAS
ncbi:MAG: acyltransferase [Deltaproteobacteria bacterium]|jgi:1-acyl-sn-glycerol-3-phosphate acyltransferase|nr:acyltransferase [Deltaproteobacteria bacterium]